MSSLSESKCECCDGKTHHLVVSFRNAYDIGAWWTPTTTTPLNPFDEDDGPVTNPLQIELVYTFGDKDDQAVVLVTSPIATGEAMVDFVVLACPKPASVTVVSVVVYFESETEMRTLVGGPLAWLSERGGKFHFSEDSRSFFRKEYIKPEPLPLSIDHVFYVKDADAYRELRLAERAKLAK